MKQGGCDSLRCERGTIMMWRGPPPTLVALGKSKNQATWPDCSCNITCLSCRAYSALKSL